MLTHGYTGDPIANGHQLRRYTLNTESRELTYIEYHIRCFEEAEGFMAIVIHPHLIHAIVNQSPVPSEYFAYLNMDIDEDTLTFTPLNVDAQWFGEKTLKRSQRQAYFQQLLADERYKQINRFPEDEYVFTLALYAITEDALYILNDDGQYLRVPKSMHPQLPDVHFSEDAGLIHFQSATYLAFDSRNLYFDITTEAQREALGIKLVQRIE